MLALPLYFAWLILIGLLYGILQTAGIIDRINHLGGTISGQAAHQAVTPGIVFGGAAAIGLLNAALFIGLAALGARVYNLCADLIGGVEITLTETG